MKNLVFVFSILLSHVAFADTNCLGEAQIIAQVSKVKKHTIMECVVEIDTATIVHYNMNLMCPLDIDEVLATGVNVGIKDGHDCSHNAGDKISGILVKKPWGIIVLE